MQRNRFLCLFLFIITLVLASACNRYNQATTSNTSITIDSKYLNNTVKPLITIEIGEKHIIINKGTDYDLLKGIRGIDDLEGDITHKIQIQVGEFNKDVPGTYTIYYFLTDLAGNEADVVTKTITVVDNAILPAPPIYTGLIPDEKPAPNPPGMFLGAWYHKVVSSRDAWVGIEGTITLPIFQIRRYESEQYDATKWIDHSLKNLDNPSIYLGGNAGYESDVGLSLSRGCLNRDCTMISKGSLVFRPFWRYITSQDNADEGGYDVHQGKYAVSCSGNSIKNCIANWTYLDTQYYYLPGDKLRIIVYSPEPNYLQLQIEVLEISTLPEAVQMREKYGWKQPENFKSPLFHSPGHGSSTNVEFKRVNAIDQVNNEGKPAIITSSEVGKATWHNTYLYRVIDNIMYRVPLTTARSAYVSSPDSDKFTITFGEYTEDGGSVVEIHPSRKRDD